MSKPLISIVGPTAIGKSGIALELARQLDGEIVNADSRQVYRRMDIGTAKPTAEERAPVPHHLFDIIEPDEDFSLARYKDLASEAIASIHQRNRVPLLVGGSGQYVWAILEGWSIPRVAPNARVRRDLEKRAASEGGDVLYRELENIDPKAAARIDPRNVRRVIRALEVCLSSGKRFSDLSFKQAPDFSALVIGLTAERPLLYERIDARVDRMIARGLVAEVRDLVDAGYSLTLPSMSGLGYRQIGQYLNGEITLAEAVQRIKYETHRFARQQYTWFRPDDRRIQWFDVEANPIDEIRDLAAELVKAAGSNSRAAG